jgi:hypothetical protein
MGGLEIDRIDDYLCGACVLWSGWKMGMWVLV